MTLRVPADVAAKMKGLAAEFVREEAEVRALVEGFWDVARRDEKGGDWWRIALKAARRRLERDEDEREASEDSAMLFDDVVERIRAHYYFEEEWHYTICALFVFQAWAVRAGALPAVFYLYFGGAFATGKSNILALVASLTDGLMLENVSPSAVARVVENARTLLLDEFDVERGQELDDVMSALLRSGYRRNGPPYVRWNAKERKADVVPVFGPKSLSGNPPSSGRRV